MDIFLVRHGQSEANAGLTRHLDSPITPLGLRQAELTGERLKSESITAAFVSPLLRTLQTMDAICGVIGRRAIAVPGLHEYFSPKYIEYLSFAGLDPEDIRQRFVHIDVGDEYPCGAQWWPSAFEDPERCSQRVSHLCRNLLARYFDSAKSILIVGHADPLGWMIEAFAHERSESGKPPWLDNCSITHLKAASRDAPATPILLNDTSHLGSLLRWLGTRSTLCLGRRDVSVRHAHVRSPELLQQDCRINYDIRVNPVNPV